MGGGIEGMEFTGAKAILHKIYGFFFNFISVWTKAMLYGSKRNDLKC